MLVPIRVAPQAGTRRRATSLGDEHIFRYYKSLQDMKTLRDYQQTNRGILNTQVLEVMIDKINLESRTNEKTVGTKSEGSNLEFQHLINRSIRMRKQKNGDTKEYIL